MAISLETIRDIRSEMERRKANMDNTSMTILLEGGQKIAAKTIRESFPENEVVVEVQDSTAGGEMKYHIDAKSIVVIGYAKY